MASQGVLLGLQLLGQPWKGFEKVGVECWQWLVMPVAWLDAGRNHLHQLKRCADEGGSHC
eukprot:513283-Pelagomonas_calceolata.AAC.4